MPVSHGDVARIRKPDGAMRKASPKAAAAWGTESRGEMTCCIRANARVPDQAATNANVMASDMAVVAIPVVSDRPMDFGTPGVCQNVSKWVSVRVSPPSAGK